MSLILQLAVKYGCRLCTTFNSESYFSSVMRQGRGAVLTVLMWKKLKKATGGFSYLFSFPPNLISCWRWGGTHQSFSLTWIVSGQEVSFDRCLDLLRLALILLKCFCTGVQLILWIFLVKDQTDLWIALFWNSTKSFSKRISPNFIGREVAVMRASGTLPPHFAILPCQLLYQGAQPNLQIWSCCCSGKVLSHFRERNCITCV